MNENEMTDAPDTEGGVNEYVLKGFELETLSSAETVTKKEFDAATTPAENDAASDEPADEEADPVFAALAAPTLPTLPKENRAWLQMQSPNKLFFYWSIKNNPFQTLNKVLNGNQSNYQLVAKFINTKSGYEQMFPVEAEGNFWFNAESDAVYQAEIGFYATARPYFRIVFSDEIETPRRTPSPRQATESDWAISAAQFAEVLDNSGFTRDAFEVALAGDDEENAKIATAKAFSQLFADEQPDFKGFNEEEVRFALLALASGIALDELRGHISDALFDVLAADLERMTAENALAALEENFDVFTDEIFEEEFTGAAVYGASLVNFPKTLRKRAIPKTLAPKNALTNLSPRLLAKLSPFGSLRP